MENKENSMPIFLRKQDQVLEILDKLVKHVEKLEKQVEKLENHREVDNEQFNMKVDNIIMTVGSLKNDIAEKRLGECPQSYNLIQKNTENQNTNRVLSFDEVYKKYFNEEIFESFFGEVTKKHITY
jgi:transcriptional regulator NrdR family protein